MYRLSWQRVWVIPPGKDSVVLLSWKPDGSCMCGSKYDYKYIYYTYMHTYVHAYVHMRTYVCMSHIIIHACIIICNMHTHVCIAHYTNTHTHMLINSASSWPQQWQCDASCRGRRLAGSHIFRWVLSCHQSGLGCC